MSRPDDTERMWARWYQLSYNKREQLVRKYGSSFNAAYAIYGAGRNSWGSFVLRAGAL